MFNENWDTKKIIQQTKCIFVSIIFLFQYVKYLKIFFPKSYKLLYNVFPKRIINCKIYYKLQEYVSKSPSRWTNERIIFLKMETYHFTIARFYSVKYTRIIHPRLTIDHYIHWWSKLKTHFKFRRSSPIIVQEKQTDPLLSGEHRYQIAMMLHALRSRFNYKRFKTDFW